MFAADLGIDVWEAIDAADTKPFGFMRFEPGPGVGGHCLPIDPSYLAWKVQDELGAPFRFVELANDVNDFMPEYVVRRLDAGLHDRGRALDGARVLLVGLAYKPETGDAREAPALRIAELLAGLGAEVRAADPYVVDEVHGLDPDIGLMRVDLDRRRGGRGRRGRGRHPARGLRLRHGRDARALRARHASPRARGAQRRAPVARPRPARGRTRA